jgi:hypothetical protein
MRGVPYDQRVLTLIEVRGGEREWAGAEHCFERHGWPVVHHFPCGEGPLSGILDPRPGARVYEVEVRLYGSAHDCDRGAARRAAKALRAARLEAYVRRTEPLLRDREMLPEWRAYRRPGPHTRLWRRVLRHAARAGRLDSGLQLSGTPREALRLARQARPGVAVRPLDGRWRRTVEMWPEEETERRIVRVCGWLLLTGVAAVFAAGTDTAARWLWLAVAVVAGGATLWSGTRIYRTGRAAGAGAGALGLVSLLPFLLGRAATDGGGWTRGQVLPAVAVMAVVAGLWLLVRQWTWGEWVAWAVPLAMTLAVSSFVAAGSVLHALYADELSLSPDDVNVPAMWQAAAALKLVSLLSLVLLLPAWWGWARHRHHSYAAPGEGFNVAMYVLLLVAILLGAGLLALDSAREAADRTKAAVRRGVDPPPYFGVRPAWTCVEPAVPPGQLAGEGPRLDPARPYLSFGTTDGTAVLWDRSTMSPVKLPASQVRLVPADSATAPCAGQDPSGPAG